MLIEDEPNAMERYSSYISSYNAAFEIVAKASTYEQARTLFAQNKPEIIFSDIVIPGNTGLRFLEEVRASNWDGLAVIISGYGDFSYAQGHQTFSIRLPAEAGLSEGLGTGVG